MPILRCDFCKILFVRRKSTIKQRKQSGLKHNFCSSKCFNKWDRKISKTKRWNESIECNFCKKFFYRPPSAKKRNKHNFCSKYCEMKWKVSFNLDKTKDLFYVLGAIHSDGWINFKKRKYYKIGLLTKDKEFANEFKKCLKNIGLTPRICIKNDINIKQGFGYLIECNSIFLIQWIKKFNISWFKNNNSKIFYLKGFFDGDGCLYKKEGYYRAIISQKNEKKITIIKKLIVSLGFKISLRKDCVDMFHVSVLGGSKETKRFIKLINPAIPRKSIIAFHISKNMKI